MTTSKPNGGDDRDPVAELLESLGAIDDDAGATEDGVAVGEEEFTGLAAALPVDAFDPSVLAAVDRVIDDSEPVDIQARRRLVAGAERGVRWRRRLVGPLPPLLQEQRQSADVALGTITQKAGLDEAAIHAVERGDTTVDKIEPSQLAAWIRAVRLTSSTALAALKQSLQLPDTRAIYAASATRTDAKLLAHKEFYEAVEQALTEAESAD